MTLESYADLCAAVTGTDPGRIISVARESIERYRSPVRGPTSELEGRWYESLENGGPPDFSVYDDPMYLADLWACWVVYSKRYLASLNRTGVVGDRSIVDLVGPVEHVVDLGCGIGLTTPVFRDAFGAVRATGTQLEDTSQFAVAERYLGPFAIDVVGRLADVRAPSDVILASEYFEHFEDPISHVQEVVDALRPRWMIVANAFAARSIGHFPSYLVPGLVETRVPNSAIGRDWSRGVRALGYEKVKTKLWNQRPAIWRRT